MPNYVYCTIQITEELSPKQKDILSEIDQSGGIARYYRPMPEELQASEARFPETEQNAELEKKYGYSSWYPWALEHWGTKWGCCDFNGSEDLISFSTAWSPLNIEIIELFAQDFPNFVYTWEEEQGFGEQCEYINGESQYHSEWDMPDWDEFPDPKVEAAMEEHNIAYLSRDYEKLGITYRAGFYSEWDLEDFFSTDPQDVLNLDVVE